MPHRSRHPHAMHVVASLNEGTNLGSGAFIAADHLADMIGLIVASVLAVIARGYSAAVLTRDTAPGEIPSPRRYSVYAGDAGLLLGLPGVVLALPLAVVVHVLYGEWVEHRSRAQEGMVFNKATET